MIDNNLLVALCLTSRLKKTGDTKSFGAASWHRIIRHLNLLSVENPSYLLNKSERSLIIDGFDEKTADRIIRLLQNADDIIKIIDRLKSNGINVIGLDDDNYPERIIKKLKDNAPPVLFYAGNPELMNTTGISVVGSRKPTVNAQNFARKMGNACAYHNYTLISGGATGCDCIAEYNCTEFGGNSLIFLAMPLARQMKIPRMEKAIANNRICLVSDHNPSDIFNTGYAINRNRYIYACGNCAVVCDSAENKGGSFNGAMDCINNNYGLVTAFDDENSKGNQLLINNGAISVKTVDDVLHYATKC